jgi:putative membrane protein
MLDFLNGLYPWIKALHLAAIISWMAALFYLPRLLVHHVERTIPGSGSEMDSTFQMMEEKLHRVIMTPAMIVAWLCGLFMISFGVLDFGAVWAWAKLGGVIAMTIFHIWLGKERKAVAQGHAQTGRAYRLANEVPTLLMLLILVAVVVRPF